MAALRSCGSQPQVLADSRVTPKAVTYVSAFHQTGLGSQPQVLGVRAMHVGDNSRRCERRLRVRVAALRSCGSQQQVLTDSCVTPEAVTYVSAFHDARLCRQTHSLARQENAVANRSYDC